MGRKSKIKVNEARTNKKSLFFAKNKNVFMAKIRVFSIRNKIIACFLIPILFMVVLGLLSYSKSKEGMSENYLSSTVETLNMATKYIDQGCEFANSECLSLALDSEVKELMLGLYDKDESSKAMAITNVRTKINSTLTANDFVQAIHIIPGSNANIITSNTSVNIKGIMDEHLKSIGDDKKNVTRWIDNHPLLDEKLGKDNSSYIISDQLSGGQGTYLVIVDVKASTIRKFLKDLALGDGSMVFLVTKNGREIACSSDPDIKDPEVSSVYNSDYFNVVTGTSAKEGAFKANFNGRTYYFLFAKNTDKDITLCALVPEGTITGQAQSIKNITFIFLIIAAVISAIFGLFVVQGIQSNLKHISSKLNEVAKGDLTVTVKSKGHDEFNLLSNSAMDMISNTKNLVHKVTNASEELGISAEHVGSASGVINEYSQGISKSIDEIAHGMMVQSENAMECVNKTDVLSNNIKEANEVLSTVKSLLTETENMITSGMEIVDSLGVKAFEASESARLVSESIDKLKEESKSINSFVDTITSISGQTNLLSLNASIEAARAGDAGRGFAVVAEEIRKLADESNNAAAEIGRNVTEISKNTDASVENSNKALEMVETQKEAVNNAIALFESMKDSIEKLTKSVDSAVASIEKADNERGEAVSAVNNISAIIAQATGNAEEVNSMAAYLLENVETLSETAKVLEENMSGLTKEISLFTI